MKNSFRYVPNPGSLSDKKSNNPSRNTINPVLCLDVIETLQKYYITNRKINMKKVRIDKLLSDYQFGSRNDIKQMIKEHRIFHNHMLVMNAQQKVEYESTITVDDIDYRFSEHVYLMLNKPKGYECSHDSQHPTVYDLIPLPYPKSLFTVGRLDIDTTGLLLLSTDGDWAHRITAKKNQSTKTYLVTLNELVDERINRLNQPIILEPEGKVLAKEINVINEYQILLSITDGKYHQVKRMMHATGYEVIDLSRVKIGSLVLDEHLDYGRMRNLTNEEKNLVFDNIE